MNLKRFLPPLAALFMVSAQTGCDDKPEAPPLPQPVVDYVTNVQAELRYIADRCSETPEGALREVNEANLCYRQKSVNALKLYRAEFEETFSDYRLEIRQDGYGFSTTPIPRAIPQ